MEKETVELLKPHTHEGKARKPGDRIELWPDQAAWLKSIGVAKSASPKPANTQAKE